MATSGGNGGGGDRIAGTPPVIGIIGGSGVYDIDGLEDAQWTAGRHRRGARPPDELLFGGLDGQKWSSCRATAAATAFRRRS